MVNVFFLISSQNFPCSLASLLIPLRAFERSPASVFSVPLCWVVDDSSNIPFSFLFSRMKNSRSLCLSLYSVFSTPPFIFLALRCTRCSLSVSVLYPGAMSQALVTGERSLPSTHWLHPALSQGHAADLAVFHSRLDPSLWLATSPLEQQVCLTDVCPCPLQKWFPVGFT